MTTFRGMLRMLGGQFGFALAAASAAVADIAPAMVPVHSYASLASRPNGKGKPSKRKRRPNRLHISRRVRRKHRRAA